MSIAASFTLTPDQKLYLDTFMNKVSRSFAIVVPWVEEPLNHFLATAYLLCRVVDNIEDCGHPFTWKRRRFGEFALLLETPAMAGKILKDWETHNWPCLTGDEQKLMSLTGGSLLWQIYSRIPEEIQVMIRRWTLAMAEGMSRFENPEQGNWLVKRNHVQVLSREEYYNYYCYYVAGTVGHLATELVIHYYHLDAQEANRLLETCEACGRGLQKTNIIKDFAEDLERGMCYLPDDWLHEAGYTPLILQGATLEWKRKVLMDVLQELQEASEYVLALPYRARGYRMASLLCLLPAYQTISLAAAQQEKLFTREHAFKISRLTMAQCVHDAQLMLTDNHAMIQYCQRIHRTVDQYLTP